jgi:hypothetical protein
MLSFESARAGKRMIWAAYAYFCDVMGALGFSIKVAMA